MFHPAAEGVRKILPLAGFQEHLPAIIGPQQCSPLAAAAVEKQRYQIAVDLDTC